MAAQGTSSIPKEFEDAFIKITFEEDTKGVSTNAKEPLYDVFTEHTSAKYSDPSAYVFQILRKLYPNYSIVGSNDYNVNIFAYPGALIQPVDPSSIISSTYFVPLGVRDGQIPGVLVESVKYAAFRVAWGQHDFLLYVFSYLHGFGDNTQFYYLNEGPEDPARALLIAAGAWANKLHEEIYVFNQGYWSKSHELWTEVQKANWTDVILDADRKTALRKDINGFWEAEELYRSLSIPWKRGLIMYGPPGNGKTISLKAIMKDCDAKGYNPLYVKSFQSWMGEEGSMAAVFAKARQLAPCVVVLEDLDSLINDRNRSFFLNQLDGLEGNDGLLVIGTTNHFERLDPALSGRPSRFDRKYEFDDPTEDERALYAKYWQTKLRNNKQIIFPDSLVDEVASSTGKFSFAYLKEVFVAALVLLADSDEDPKPSFESVIKSQIKKLRKQLDHDAEQRLHSSAFQYTRQGAYDDLPHPQSRGGFFAPTVDSRQLQQDRIWSYNQYSSSPFMPGEMPSAGPGPQRPEGRRDIRGMALAAAALGRSFMH